MLTYSSQTCVLQACRTVKAAMALPRMLGVQTTHPALEASLQSLSSTVPQQMGCHSPLMPLQQGIAWPAQKQVAASPLCGHSRDVVYRSRFQIVGHCKAVW